MFDPTAFPGLSQMDQPVLRLQEEGIGKFLTRFVRHGGCPSPGDTFIT